MSIFSSILAKIGIGKPAADAKAAEAAKAQADAAVTAAMAKAAEEAKARVAAAQAKPAAPVPMASAPNGPPASFTPAAAPAPVAPAALHPAAIPVVDVVAKLQGMASAHPGLDWKVSIVDLLKLLDIDSSLESRKALATELGCPADQMADSARMNVWLHKTVLQKIAENGGNIPASLLD